MQFLLLVQYVFMISLTFKVLFVKIFSLMLCLGLSVPEDIPRCSASTLSLLASFTNSGVLMLECLNFSFASTIKFCPSY